MYALLSLRARRLRWLGYAQWMGVGRISKDQLCGQLAEGVRPIGLRFKDVCKRDMKLTDGDINTMDSIAEDGKTWCSWCGRHAYDRGD